MTKQELSAMKKNVNELKKKIKGSPRTWNRKYEHDLPRGFKQWRGVFWKDGRVLVQVPVEYAPPALVKYCIACALYNEAKYGRRHF